MADNLKLIATGHQLLVGALEEVIAGHKMDILIPTRVGSLHLLRLLVHSGQDGLVRERPLFAVVQIGAPVKVPKGGYGAI